MKDREPWLFALGVALLVAASMTSGWLGTRETRVFEQRLATGARRAPVSDGMPRRIVSTDYRGDEMLLALVPAERILALSHDADNPLLGNAIEEARAVGLRTDDTVERLLHLQPDLVILAPTDAPFTAGMLAAAGIKVLHLNRTYTIDEIQQNVLAIGDAAGEPIRARAVVDEMNAALGRLRGVTGRSRPARGLYVGSGRTYTAGIGTYTDELMRAAGIVNVAREAGVQAWGTLSVEKAVAMNPDVIFVPDGYEDRLSPVRVRELFPTPMLSGDPVWRDVKAVREGRVYKMPNRLLMCASQLNVRTAVAMAATVYGIPEPLAPDGSGSVWGDVRP